MARRERTTGLPRPHRRDEVARRGFQWGDNTIRTMVLGAVGLLLAVVVVLVGWAWYQDNVLRPREVVLRVGDSQVDLGYFSDRLFQFARANPEQGSLLGQALLAKLEEEELTVQLAKANGIDLSDQAVTDGIAISLGLPAGGKGSAFDRAYREHLKQFALSDEAYRRIIRGQLAADGMLERYRAEAGEKGEGVSVRVVLVRSREEAAEIIALVRAGEDLGTLAQTRSLDVVSRGRDGLTEDQPIGILPQSVQDAIKDKPAGTLFDPVEDDGLFWAFRLESRHEITYSETQREQLAGLKLDEGVKAQRLVTPPRRSLDAGDFQWAAEKAF